MAQDWQFEVIPQPNRSQFRVKDGVMQVWCLGKGPWRDNDYYEGVTEFPDPRIHADPNNTFERLFGSDRELTFEEAWAAVGKGMIVHCTADEFEWLIKLSDDKYNVHLVIRNWNCSWCTGWRNAEKGISKEWTYRLYKEPTQPEPTPQPEPLTLEALEARVKALEERS